MTSLELLVYTTDSWRPITRTRQNSWVFESHVHHWDVTSPEPKKECTGVISPYHYQDQQVQQPSTFPSLTTDQQVQQSTLGWYSEKHHILLLCVCAATPRSHFLRRRARPRSPREGSHTSPGAGRPAEGCGGAACHYICVHSALSAPRHA